MERGWTRIGRIVAEQMRNLILQEATEDAETLASQFSAFSASSCSIFSPIGGHRPHPHSFLRFQKGKGPFAAVGEGACSLIDELARN